MVKVAPVAKMLGITDNRVKQIVKENKGNPNYRYTTNNSKHIVIPWETVRTLVSHRGKKYQFFMSTIGIEKGGCGKSLLTLTVAIYLSMFGRKVLIIDLDPEAHITHFFLSQAVLDECITAAEVFDNKIYFDDAICKTKYPHLDIVAGDKKTRKLDKMIGGHNPAKIILSKMKNISKNYDVVLFDVSSWYARVTESAYITSDIVIIPTIPDKWAIESVGATIEDIKESATDFDCCMPIIKVVMNKYGKKRTASLKSWEDLVAIYREIVLPFQIKEATDFQNTANEGFSIFEKRTNPRTRENIADIAMLISPLIDL